MKKNKILSAILMLSSIVCSPVAINNKVFSEANIQCNKEEIDFNEGIRSSLDETVSDLVVSKIENNRFYMKNRGISDSEGLEFDLNDLDDLCKQYLSGYFDGYVRGFVDGLRDRDDERCVLYDQLFEEWKKEGVYEKKKSKIVDEYFVKLKASLNEQINKIQEVESKSKT